MRQHRETPLDEGCRDALHRGELLAEEEGAAAAAGDAFADFDAFPTSSAVQNSLEADTASGSASGVPGSSEPEADDFANWGDGDFTSAESSSTVKGTHAIFANARRCLS